MAELFMKRRQDDVLGGRALLLDGHLHGDRFQIDPQDQLRQLAERLQVGLDGSVVRGDSCLRGRSGAV